MSNFIFEITFKLLLYLFIYTIFQNNYWNLLEISLNENIIQCLICKIFIFCICIWYNQIITVFVGGMLLATGAAYLTKSIMQCVYKAPIGWILINFLITAGCIALGVVSLVFYSQDPESSKTTMMVIYIILGTSITVLGIFDLIFAIQTHKLKQQESAVKGEQSETKIVDDEMIIVDGKVKAKKKRERKAKQLNMENKELPHQDNNNENQNPEDNNDSQN